MKKTNVIRQLEQADITYTPLFFDPEAPGFSFSRVLEQNDLSPSDIFKTLVAKGNKTGVLVAVIPLDTQLDYKALAVASNNKKTTMLPLKDLYPTTGYVRGGCAPMGMKSDFPVFFDKEILQQERVYVNAGERGKLIGVAPRSLLELSGGTLVEGLASRS